MIRIGLVLALGLGVGSSAMAQFGAPPAVELQLDRIQLPPGFHIDLYTRDVPDARSMTLGSEGTVFVGT
ncbi:MAG: sorbosone dehydrogenase family protein, partial [Acidobacteriota bacterium]